MHNSNGRSDEHDERQAVAALPVRKAKTRVYKDSQGAPQSSCGPCHMKRHRAMSGSNTGRGDNAPSMEQWTTPPAQSAPHGALDRPASAGPPFDCASRAGSADAHTQDVTAPVPRAMSRVLSHMSPALLLPLNVGGVTLMSESPPSTANALVRCGSIALDGSTGIGSSPSPQVGGKNQRDGPLGSTHDLSVRDSPSGLALVSSGAAPSQAPPAVPLCEEPQVGFGHLRPNKNPPRSVPPHPRCGDDPVATFPCGSESPATQPRSSSVIGRGISVGDRMPPRSPLGGDATIDAGHRVDVTDNLSRADGAVSRDVLATYSAADTHLLQCLAAAKSPEALSALRVSDILGSILAKTTPPGIKVTHGDHRVITYRRWATPL